MDNEATKILAPEQNATQGQPTVNNLQEEKKEGNAAKTKSDKGSTFFARTAATAAGAALGTSAAMAAEHIIEASTDASDEVDAAMAEEEQVQAVAAETETKPESAPQQETAEHDAIVATDEGVRVAQVDDSLSFSQAFAEARSQVGAGGVFEWNGKVYSTYYAEEWDGMSASERSDWQARVDYGDVIDASEPSVNATSSAGQNDNLMAEAEVSPDRTSIDNSAEHQTTAQVADTNVIDASEPSVNATSPAGQNDNLMAEAEVSPDNTYIDNSAEHQTTAQVADTNVIDASEPSVNATSPAGQNDLMAETEMEPDSTYTDHPVEQQSTAQALETEIAPDSTYIDNSAVQQATAQVVDDNEVHVVGVAVQDNAQGGVATLAGLQSGDEMAILLDVDTDGTIDLIASDLNDDGQFGADEVHDISDREIATGDVVGAYVEEAHMHGATAVVTDLDSGSQYQITETADGYGLTPMDDANADADMYMASNDDMPDYINDADAGIMDT